MRASIAVPNGWSLAPTARNDIDRGIANIDIGFASPKPGEFVMIQMAPAATR